VTDYTVARPGSTPVSLGAAARSHTFTGLAAGTSYSFSVTATNAVGTGPAANAAATTPGTTDPPSAPTSLALVDATRSSVTVRWAAPASDGGLPLQGYQVRRGSGTWVDVPSGTLRWTFTALAAGTTYQFSVRARNAEGLGGIATLQVATDPAVRASAPRIGTAASGVAGGTVTATAAWAAPTSNGGSAITSYRVTALRMSSTGAVLSRTTKTVGASARRLAMTLRAGKYRFQVVAVNAVGASPASARSNLVTAR
jgi:hypothetical protein